MFLVCCLSRVVVDIVFVVSVLRVVVCSWCVLDCVCCCFVVVCCCLLIVDSWCLLCLLLFVVVCCCSLFGVCCSSV